MPMKIKKGVIYGVANAGINEWKKTELGINLWTHYLNTYYKKVASNLPESANCIIDNVLGSKDRQPYWDLPINDIPKFFEFNASCVFTDNNSFEWWTRSSSVILINESNEGIFYERSFNQKRSRITKIFVTRLLLIKYVFEKLTFEKYGKLNLDTDTEETSPQTKRSLELLNKLMSHYTFSDAIEQFTIS